MVDWKVEAAIDRIEDGSDGQRRLRREVLRDPRDLREQIRGRKHVIDQADTPRFVGVDAR